MTWNRFWSWVALVVMFGLLFAFLVSCAERPINVMPLVNCSQPTTLSLSPPVSLPQVPRLPGDDPSMVVGILSETAALDAKLYQDEVAKREELIDHGVRLCGWTR